MSNLLSRSTFVFAGASVVALSGLLSSHASGVESGVSSMPANGSRALNSCAACHSSSAPTATRTNGPTTTITVGSRTLAAGAQTSVTTTVTGGVATTTGGFLCEATAGSFTAGTGSHVNTSVRSITHSDRTRRTWTYTFTAPATPGVVEITSVGMSSNGSGSSGDRISFTGYDNNATVGTPLRVYVLPTGLTNFGTGCADGYGNVPVLGATTIPAPGNAAFAFQMAGASPNTMAFLLMGFNPGGFGGMDLGLLFGITGCNGYVANPLATQTAFTSAGNALRGEGSCLFPFGIPNSPSFSGFQIDVQAACLDNSVATSRAVPVTFSNGVHMVVQ